MSWIWTWKLLNCGNVTASKILNIYNFLLVYCVIVSVAVLTSNVDFWWCCLIYVWYTFWIFVSVCIVFCIPGNLSKGEWCVEANRETKTNLHELLIRNADFMILAINNGCYFDKCFVPKFSIDELIIIAIFCTFICMNWKCCARQMLYPGKSRIRFFWHCTFNSCK